MITEEIIRQLLENEPHLLSFGADDILKARKWILVDREVGIPTEEGGSSRWYLDHLFLDNEAIPTLVEVKLIGNDQIRRTVIGQMFDYATYATKYWPIEIIQSKFEQKCLLLGVDPIMKVAHLLSQKSITKAVYDAYWKRVYKHLQTGRVRLVFLADQIPNELNDIVIFLRYQMDPAEVCSVEIGKYIAKYSQLLDDLSVVSTSVGSSGPDYNLIYKIAEAQAGYFTAKQAREVGFSWERLSSNAKSGKFLRISHGIYRLVHFPGSPYEDLFVAWLRTGPDSVISHDSALALYDLSDLLPSEIHVIVPRTASRRRRGIRQHTNQINPNEITSYEGLPVTTVARTIVDVSINGLAAELVQQAIRESLQQGLTSRDELLNYANQKAGRVRQIIQATLSE